MIGRAGERETERARGTMGRGKREERAEARPRSCFFPLPIVPRALSIFRLLLFQDGGHYQCTSEVRVKKTPALQAIAIFIGIPSGRLHRARRE